MFFYSKFRSAIMQIDIINHIHRENIVEFKTTVFKRQWNILILITDGEYSIQLENRRNPIVLKAGDIAFIPSNTHFERAVVSAPVSYYHIAFYSQSDHPFYLSTSAGKINMPEAQLASIFKSVEYAFLLPNNKELITHLIERIFVENYMFGKSKRRTLQPFSEEITSTINYMNRNLSKKIDIDELAARVYLSHSGLIWKFKKELDTTPLQYLNMLRLRYSKQLLLSHAYSITQISEMCGYSNPYYFTNMFHKYAGMSPTEYRAFYLKSNS